MIMIIISHIFIIITIQNYSLLQHWEIFSSQNKDLSELVTQLQSNKVAQYRIWTSDAPSIIQDP